MKLKLAFEHANRRAQASEDLVKAHVDLSEQLEITQLLLNKIEEIAASSNPSLAEMRKLTQSANRRVQRQKAAPGSYVRIK